MNNFFSVVLVILSITTQVYAQTSTTVSMVQSPAWQDYQGEFKALRIGEEIPDQSKVITGKNARVMLKLGDGSIIKLGENVEFRIEELVAPREEGEILKGFLNVIKGAFRYTTSKISKKFKRDLKVNVSTTTIGIRGTDVWGKAEPTRDFVVLIEGEISIERDNESYQMNEPLSLFMAPKGQAAEPLQPVNMDNLAVWAQETEPQAGKGVQIENGEWKVILASHENEQLAVSVQNRLESDGVPTNIIPVIINGNTWFRVVIDQLQSRLDAEYVSAGLKTNYGFNPWINNH